MIEAPKTAEKIVFEVLELANITAEQAIGVIEALKPSLDRDWSLKAIHILDQATTEAHESVDLYDDDFTPITLQEAIIYFDMVIPDAGANLEVARYGTQSHRVLIKGVSAIIRWVGFKPQGEDRDFGGAERTNADGVYIFDVESETYKKFLINGQFVRDLEDHDSCHLKARFETFGERTSNPKEGVLLPLCD